MKTIKLDFTSIESLNEMHALLAATFKFPSFYGGNVNALIDCWSSLRFPEDGMTAVSLSENEPLLIEVKRLDRSPELVVNHFLSAVSGVNDRNIELGAPPSIFLMPL